MLSHFQNSPLLSIVIPCYNRENFIATLISELLSQLDSTVEIIVIDDGSTDQSWEIIQTYLGKIKFASQKNKGPSAARNLGVKLARGRFIKFIDADDKCQAEGLIKVLGLSLNANPREIFLGDAISIDTNGRNFTTCRHDIGKYVEPGRINRLNLISLDIPCWLPIFPKEALLQVGLFNEHLWVGEDTDLALRLVAAGYYFVRKPIIVAKFCEHEESRLTLMTSEITFLHLYNSFKAYIKTCESFSNYSDLEKIALGKKIWVRGRDAARFNYPKISNSLFRLANRVGGEDSKAGSFIVLLAYKFLPPFTTERVLCLVKLWLAKLRFSRNFLH